MIAPTKLNNKQKVFEETFESPFQKESESEALQVLDEIRKSHNADSGWVEFEGFTKQLRNGKWIAIRHHAKYE